MNRMLVAASCAVFFIASMALNAEETAPLGNGNIALKLDYIVFTDSFFDRPEAEEDGVYVGIEGYWNVYPNLYLGGEVGAGNSISLFSSDIDYFPVELNLKYALEPASNLVIDFGGGLSYNFAELNTESFFGPRESVDDWLVGAQVFGGLTYKINWFSIGVEAKYQLTEDFRDSDSDLSNFRAGIRVGVIF